MRWSSGPTLQSHRHWALCLFPQCCKHGLCTAAHEPSAIEIHPWGREYCSACYAERGTARFYGQPMAPLSLDRGADFLAWAWRMANEKMFGDEPIMTTKDRKALRKLLVDLSDARDPEAGERRAYLVLGSAVRRWSRYLDFVEDEFGTEYGFARPSSPQIELISRHPAASWKFVKHRALCAQAALQRRATGIQKFDDEADIDVASLNV